MVITSKSNPLIKEIVALSDKKFRSKLGLYIVEGTKTVNECIAAGCEITKVVCSEELIADYHDAVAVSRDIFEYISSEKTPQGVLAVVKIPQNFLKPPESSCLLLDCLQDPGNLGTIIRTANAAGYKDLYLINCTDPYSAKAVRASMSGIFFINVYRGERAEILSMLDGLPLICADMDGENIFSFVPPKKFCLCIGNEGGGISDEVMKTADYKISIPMSGTCESLNAAVSAGIAMYQLKYNLKR
ncbi:MAG: RNA methyltransferase [Clostridia bacterium]|jgi:TrmH family RNA methyltransferase|nr:RNA methyltransferase [Clostridia bacterium]